MTLRNLTRTAAGSSAALFIAIGVIAGSALAYWSAGASTSGAVPAEPAKFAEPVPQDAGTPIADVKHSAADIKLATAVTGSISSKPGALPETVIAAVPPAAKDAPVQDAVPQKAEDAAKDAVPEEAKEEAKDDAKDEAAEAETADKAPAPAIDISFVELPDDCAKSGACIDRYLFTLYERAPKLDAQRVREKRKVKVRNKKGKLVTRTRTFTRIVHEDFTWKDPHAAQRFGMPMMEYVIGGMDKNFKLKLFHLLREAEILGMTPGITSAFRDDYRQSIATGTRAASNKSFHGGSTRGGYGHGLAVDVVSLEGATRGARWLSTARLWKWIDDNGGDFGLGRPYRDRDPPHVTPIDGREYAMTAHHRPVKPVSKVLAKTDRLSVKTDQIARADEASAKAAQAKQAALPTPASQPRDAQPKPVAATPTAAKQAPSKQTTQAKPAAQTKQASQAKQMPAARPTAAKPPARQATQTKQASQPQQATRTKQASAK